MTTMSVTLPVELLGAYQPVCLCCPATQRATIVTYLQQIDEIRCASYEAAFARDPLHVFLLAIRTFDVALWQYDAPRY